MLGSITQTLKAVADGLAQLSVSTNNLASSVIAHDAQIEALLIVSEKHEKAIAALAEESARTERQWQAYINTLPRH